MRYTLLKFLRDQLSTPPPLHTHVYNLTNKTIVITGANTGLGFEAAKHFARMKPGKVVLACRNMGKAERAAELLLKVSERRRGLSVYKFGCLIRLTLLLSSPSRRSLVRGKRG